MRKNFGLWLLLVVLMVNFIFGFGWQFYQKYQIFDIILHFLGGWAVWLILAGYFSSSLAVLPRRHGYFFLLAGVALTGVIWELAEYTANQFWGTGPNGLEFIGNLTDTISDLALDLLGGGWGLGLKFLTAKKAKSGSKF